MTTAKPILMSAPMVLATLREIEAPGTGKTQTRRIIKPQPVVPADLEGSVNEAWQAGFVDVKCPYGKPGDLLYVREHWRTLHTFDCLKPSHLPDDISKITYEADPENRNPLWAFGRFRHSMHMPRWASRITLEITDVRAERLQDISHQDAIAEGITEEMTAKVARDGGLAWGEVPKGTHDDAIYWLADYSDDLPEDADRAVTLYPRESYKALWTSINGPESWDRNDWVWAVTFKPHLINVDQFIKARVA